jgi:hypothetical protein
MAVSKIISAEVNQKCLTQWTSLQVHDPQRNQVHTAFPDLDKLLTHLAAKEIKGPLRPLDLP